VLRGEDDAPELVRKVSDALNRRQNPGTSTPGAKAAQQQAAARQSQQAAGDPGAVKITFGKNAGKTFAEVGEKSASWYAENAKEADLRAAAQAYIDSLHTEPAAPVSGSDEAEPPPDYSDVPPDITDPFNDQ